MPRPRLLIALALAVTVLCSCAQAAPRKPSRVLVFTKTTGFRHASIPDGVKAIRRIGRRDGFSVDATADAGVFNARRLGRYDAVIFLSATGTPLARAGERRALENYIRGGGGFLGIH